MNFESLVSKNSTKKPLLLSDLIAKAVFSFVLFLCVFALNETAPFL